MSVWEAVDGNFLVLWFTMSSLTIIRLKCVPLIIMVWRALRDAFKVWLFSHTIEKSTILFITGNHLKWCCCLRDAFRSRICLAPHPLVLCSSGQCLKASFPTFRFGNTRATNTFPSSSAAEPEQSYISNRRITTNLRTGYLWDHFVNSISMHLDFASRSNDYSMLLHLQTYIK